MEMFLSQLAATYTVPLSRHFQCLVGDRERASHTGLTWRLAEAGRAREVKLNASSFQEMVQTPSIFSVRLADIRFWEEDSREHYVQFTLPQKKIHGTLLCCIRGERRESRRSAVTSSA